MKKLTLFILILSALALALISCGESDPYDEYCAEGEHEYFETNRVESTCTEQGYAHYQCKNCPYSYDETLNYKAHDYKLDEDCSEPATCYEDGYDCYVCSYQCGSSYNESVPQLEHNYELDEANSKASSCDEHGYTRYSCTNGCGSYYDEELELLAHNFVVETYVAPKCYDMGYIEKVCTKCGDEVSEYLNPPYKHEYQTQEAKAPTCEEEGWEEYQLCVRCGNSDKAAHTLSKLNHSMSSEWTVDVEPTDTTVGSRSHHCQNDGCKHTEDTTEIPKLGYTDHLKYSGTNSYTVVGIDSSYASQTPIISIPEEYNGKPVKHIAMNAFAGNSTLAVVKIPASVTVIDRSAFSACSNLHTVEIAEGSELWQIEAEAFAYCYNLSRINMREGLMQIDKRAFYKCAFREIVVPSSVQMVCQGAFEDCDSLESITLPKLYDDLTGDTEADTYWLGFIFGSLTAEGSSIVVPATLETVKFTKITEITEKTFKGCANVKYIILPDTVTELSENAFNDCAGLVYNVHDGVSYVGTETNPYHFLVKVSDNTKTTYELKSARIILANAFFGCSALENITLPEGLTSIGEAAFAGCAALKTVVMSEGVLDVGESAFENCTSLESVTLADSIINIHNNAFSNCSSLKTLYLPTSLEYIGANAFYECRALHNQVVIPEGVRQIGNYAFAYAGRDHFLNFSIKFTVTEGWKNTYGGYSISSSLLSDVSQATNRFTSPDTCFAMHR
ncbi:MAG: leucine-rich repeat domain-containing protein [Clostridia bacterium]|nr:leucine-rich repeat domain-containing protein [Clostridia bacterium]